MTRLLFLSLSALLLAGADRYTDQRETMVRQDLQSRDIQDADVLNAMRKTPRHEFVPEPLRDHAYADRPLPIGNGQTISQPYIVALMTQLLDVEKGHTVLEIGTGSGYQAAVLSPLVRQVYSIEIVAPLAKQARATLERIGYRNVEVREGNGYLGWPERAPFDRVIVTAAPPKLPQALLDQLKPGGKLVAPVGRGVFDQELRVYEKDRNGRVQSRTVIPVRFVPMVNEPR